MDVPYRIRHRLEQLGLEQRALVGAGPVTELQSADPRMTLSQLLQTSTGTKARLPGRKTRAVDNEGRRALLTGPR